MGTECSLAPAGAFHEPCRAVALRSAPRRAAPRLTLPALHRYVAAEPELPYGMVTGRAALYRMAATATARASMSVWFESLPADYANLNNPKFEAVLHTQPCDIGPGEVFQDPYICPYDGGFSAGCSPSDVASHSGPAPLELRMEASIESVVSPATGSVIHRVRLAPVAARPRGSL